MWNSTNSRCINLHQVRNEGGFCIQQHKKWRRIDTLEVKKRWRKFLIFASKFHIRHFIQMSGILLAHALNDCWCYVSSIHFSFLLDENKFERLLSNRSNIGNLLKRRCRIFSILVFITFLWHKHVISVAWTVPAFYIFKFVLILNDTK